MRPILTITLSALAALAFLFYAGDAEARKISRARSKGGEFSFRLESMSGSNLPTYYHKGYTYVEGKRGKRYAIRVFNHTDERVEAVVTVDGRDVISGRQGNYKKQRGYVIDPYSSVLIEGFRTSWSGVAAFRFTDIEDSYASRMGDDTNVGVIGVAVFKERHYSPPDGPYYQAKKRKGLGSGYGKKAPAPAPSASAGRAYGGCCDDLAAEEADQGIGTGYGEDEYSPASETRFKRRNRRPNARMAVYYDDRQGLIDRGVIKTYYPKPVPRKPHPFPETNDNGFAPPPPPRYYWE